MDIVNLSLSIIGALAGATMGSVLGLLVLGPILSFGQAGLKRIVVTMTMMIGIVAGIIVLPPFIDDPLRPHLAGIIGTDEATDFEKPSVQYVRDTKPVTPSAKVLATIENALAELNDPFFEAVMKQEPDRARTLMARLETAYLRGGEQELREQAKQIVVATGLTAMPHYLARAQEEDLLAVIGNVHKTISKLGIEDPAICHLWLYGQLSGRQVDYERYKEAVGLEQHMNLQSSLAQAVENSGNVVPPFEEEKALEIITSINDIAYRRLGNEKIGLINAGQMPSNVDEAKLACGTTIEMYEYIQASPYAVDAWRYFFSSAN